EVVMDRDAIDDRVDLGGVDGADLDQRPEALPQPVGERPRRASRRPCADLASGERELLGEEVADVARPYEPDRAAGDALRGHASILAADDPIVQVRDAALAG